MGYCRNICLDSCKKVILRDGCPRRLISDNGSQFVSSVMQKITYCLIIHTRTHTRVSPSCQSA
ncbi:hypothetical protein NQ314_014359 [Rhamnusium bicolor]|uniref:Integrase catalytic domain-containing protein n=1 Tax=Rhamnusium bicolor TaxID=1586634 RepID=A0AAV8X2B0_9CUCU|nr:hypothetical protein NQ314_014359 [Rhamnusium bicolor]